MRRLGSGSSRDESHGDDRGRRAAARNAFRQRFVAIRYSHVRSGARAS
jgi:hypothetical protein